MEDVKGMWMAYFLAQFPSGVFADRYGERRVILVAVGGTAVASAALALAPLFPLFVVGVVALGAVAGLHYSVATSSSFLPAFLVAYRGQPETTASLVFGGYFLVQGVTGVGVGAASDRYGRDAATAGCMVLSVAGIALLLTVPGPVAVAAAVVLLGTGLGWGGALLPRFMDHLSAAERSAGFGLVRTVYGFVGALGSVVTGSLADLFGWGVAFGFLAALLALVFTALAVNRAFSLGY